MTVDAKHDETRQHLATLGSLTGGVLHDMRTPLQTVRNNLSFVVAQLVEMDNAGEGVDGDVREELLSALRESDDALLYAASLAECSRVFLSAGDHRHAPIDLEAVLERAAMLVRHNVEGIAKVEIDVAVAGEVLGCESDLIRAVVNVMVNAAQAVDERNETRDSRLGLIEVTAYQDDDSVVIAITDNGNGMDALMVQAAIDRFATSRAASGGSGQGLAVVKRAIEQCHGGSVRFLAVPGGGTTVQLIIPREDE